MSLIAEGKTILERYQLLSLLGEGISGEVYKAWDSLREDIIAIKVLHQDVVFEWGGFDDIRPLLADICRLHHPAICSVFDFQIWKNRVLLFQEYVEGISLQELMRAQQVPEGWQRLPSLISQVRLLASALAYASNICPHGHLHPGQVILTQDGQIRLTDFGLACLWRGKGLHNIARFRRTHHYLPPELTNQSDMSKVSVGDQFSFGMLLLDLDSLTGAGSVVPDPSSWERSSINELRYRLTQSNPEGRFDHWKTVISSLGESGDGIKNRKWFRSSRVLNWRIKPWGQELLVGMSALAMVGLIIWAIQSSVNLERDTVKEQEVRLLMSERAHLRSEMLQWAARDSRWLAMAAAKMNFTATDVVERLYAKWLYHMERGDYNYANLALEDLEESLTEEKSGLEMACDAMEALVRLKDLRFQYESLRQRRNPSPSVVYAVKTLHFLYYHRENQTIRNPTMNSLIDKLTSALGETSPLLPFDLNQPDTTGTPLEDLNRWLEQGLFSRVHELASQGINILEDLFHKWERTLVHRIESLHLEYLESMTRLSMVAIPRPPYPDRLMSEALKAIHSSDFERGIIKLLKSEEIYETWVSELRTIPEPSEGQFVNSIGMRFVLVDQLWVSIWETRICDFNTFVHEKGTDSRRLWRENSDPIALTHPVVSLERFDANAFCNWLTERERKLGFINSEQEYRLPTDREWSVWVDLLNEEGDTPEARSWQNSESYPWGPELKRASDSGNYMTWPSGSPDNGYFGMMDPWMRTSPVGSFGANRFGLYDLGGNVWEVVSDDFNKVPHFPDRTLRGGSWRTMSLDFMRSNYRHAARANGEDIGFRVVVAPIQSSH